MKRKPKPPKKPSKIKKYNNFSFETVLNEIKYNEIVPCFLNHLKQSDLTPLNFDENNLSISVEKEWDYNPYGPTADDCHFIITIKYNNELKVEMGEQLFSYYEELYKKQLKNYNKKLRQFGKLQETTSQLE